MLNRSYQKSQSYGRNSQHPDYHVNVRQYHAKTSTHLHPNNVPVRSLKTPNSAVKGCCFRGLGQDGPFLCIHDSFLINHKRGEELRRVEEESTFQLTGYKIRQDIKTERLQTHRPVTSNIEPFSQPVQTTIYKPQRVNFTEEYKVGRDKFFRFRELTEQ